MQLLGRSILLFLLALGGIAAQGDGQARPEREAARPEARKAARALLDEAMKAIFEAHPELDPKDLARAAIRGALAKADPTARLEDAASRATAPTRWTESDGRVSLKLARITARDARELAERELKDARRITLDLRGATGSDLQACIAILEIFLPAERKLGGFRARGHADMPMLVTRKEPVHPDLPIVILQDQKTGGTASWLAACLVAHRRAISVGTPTAGRAVLQAPKTLSSGDALWIGGNPLVGPSGEPWPEGGLTPTISVTGPITEAVITDAFEQGRLLGYRPLIGHTVFVLESFEWDKASGADCLGFFGKVEKVGQGVSVRIESRYKLRFRPHNPPGVDATDWWPDEPKRFAYSKVDFTDWGGKRKAGDTFTAVKTRTFDARQHAAKHELAEILRPALEYVKRTGKLPGE